MQCEEVRQLHGPYLDAELDARSMVQVEQHLRICPECAEAFKQTEKLEALIASGLRQGQRTPRLWGRIEQSIAAAAPNASAIYRSPRKAQPARWRALFTAFGDQMQTSFQGSRTAWAGMAAAWVVIAVLHLAAREPDATLVANQKLPSATEMRLALQQKQLLMADLALNSKPPTGDKPKPAIPAPRTERRTGLLDA